MRGGDGRNGARAVVAHYEVGTPLPTPTGPPRRNSTTAQLSSAKAERDRVRSRRPKPRVYYTDLTGIGGMQIICAPYVRTAKRKRRGISDTTNARSEQPIIPGNSGWQSPTSARAQFVTGGSPRGFNLGMPARKLCSFAHSADHEQHYNPVRVLFLPAEQPSQAQWPKRGTTTHVSCIGL